MNSRFAERQFKPAGGSGLEPHLREIDWQRGAKAHPYVWREADYERLVNSGNLFARKFNTEVDRNIVDLLGKLAKPFSG